MGYGSKGPVWPCLALKGPEWVCMALYGPKGPCVALKGPVFQKQKPSQNEQLNYFLKRETVFSQTLKNIPLNHHGKGMLYTYVNVVMQPGGWNVISTISLTADVAHTMMDR